MDEPIRFFAERFARPTPAGVNLVVSEPDPSPLRGLLVGVLSRGVSAPLNLAMVQAWTGTHSEHAALEVVLEAQDAGLIEGTEAPSNPPSGSLEQVLGEVLPGLSSGGAAMLVDADGLVMGATGIEDEAADVLAALSADLGSVHERHRRRFGSAMGLPTSAWALVDPAGSSQVGFWPLQIGSVRFVLAVLGIPRLNSSAFVDLIWSLHLRCDAQPMIIPFGAGGGVPPIPPRPSTHHLQPKEPSHA